ncbi:unnamed protein product [Ixodes pacificus]
MIFEATQKTPDTPRAPSTEATPTIGPPAGSFGTTSEFPSGGSAAQESYPPLEHAPQFASKRIVTQGASHGRPGPTTAGDSVDTDEVPVVLSLPQPKPSQPYVSVKDIPSNISSRTSPNTPEDVQIPEPDEAVQSSNYASHSEPPASSNNAHNNHTNLSSDSANETLHVTYTDDALIDLKKENANQGTGSATSKSIDSSRQVSDSKILDVNQLNVSTVRYSQPFSDLDVDVYVEVSDEANGTSIDTGESPELLKLLSEHLGGQTDSSEPKSFDASTQTSNSNILNVNQFNVSSVRYSQPLSDMDVDDYVEASGQANGTSIDTGESPELLRLPSDHSGGQTDSSESKSFDLGAQTSNPKIHNVSQSNASTVTYLPPLHHLDIDDFVEASDDANVTSLDSGEPNELLGLPFERSGDADKLRDSDKSNKTAEVDIGVTPTEAKANDQSADSIHEAKISAPGHTEGYETTPSTDPTSWERANRASAKSLESSTKTMPLIIESSRQLNPGKATNSIVSVPPLTEHPPQSRLTKPYDTNRAASSRSDDSAILNSPDLKSSLAPRRVPSSPLSQHQIKTPIITDFGLLSKTIDNSDDAESQVLVSLIAKTMSGKKILSRSDFTRLATKPTVIPPGTTIVSLTSAVNPSKVLNWISSSANPSELLQRPVQDEDRLPDAVDTVILSTPTISAYNELNRGCASTCSWKRRSKSSAISHDAEISGMVTGATDVAETNPTPAIQVPQDHVSEILDTASRTQISEPIHPTILSSVDASENRNLTERNISHTFDPSLTLEGLELSQSSMPSDRNGSSNRTSSSVLYENGHHNRTNWSQTLTPLKPENESAILLPMSVEDDDTIRPSQKDIVQRMMTVTMLRSSFSQMTHTLIGEVLLATPASGSLLTRVTTPILETSVKLTKMVSTLTAIISSSSPTEVESEDDTSILPSRTVDEYVQPSVSNVFKRKTNQSETPALVSTHIIDRFTENDAFTNATKVKNTLPTKPFTFLQTSSELPNVIEGLSSSVHIQPSISPSPGSIPDRDNDIFNVTSEGSEENIRALKEVQVTLMNVTINSPAISDDLTLNTEPSLYTTPAFTSLHTSSHFETSELHTSSPGNDLQLEASIASSSVQTSTSGNVGTVPELGRDSINNAVIIDGSSATPTLSAKHDGKGNFSQVHSIISSWANQGSGFPYAFNNISVATRVVEYPLVRVRTRMDPPQQTDGNRRRAKWEASKRRQLAGTTARGSSNRRRKRPLGGNSTSVVVLPSSMPDGAGNPLVSKPQQNSSGGVSHNFETVLSSPNVSLYSDVSDNELSAKTSSFDDPVEESTGPEFSRSMALWPFLAPLLLLMLLPPAVWWLLKPEALPPPPFPPPPFPMPPPSSRRPPSSSHRPPSLQSW